MSFILFIAAAALVAAALLALAAKTTPAPLRDAPAGGIVAGGAAIVAAVTVAAATAWIFVALGCDGDGGSPYAAPASRRGRYCQVLDDASGLYLLFVLPILVALASAARAVRQRRPRWLVIAFAAGVLLAAALAGSEAVMPAECADEANRAQSSDCSHY